MGQVILISDMLCIFPLGLRMLSFRVLDATTFGLGIENWLVYMAISHFEKNIHSDRTPTLNFC